MQRLEYWVQTIHITMVAATVFFLFYFVNISKLFFKRKSMKSTVGVNLCYLCVGNAEASFSYKSLQNLFLFCCLFIEHE